MLYRINPRLLKVSFLFLLLVATNAGAQQKPVPVWEQALNKIAAMKDDTNKVNAYSAYIDTARVIWAVKPAAALNIIVQMQAIAEKQNFYKGRFRAYSVMVDYYSNKEDYVKALQFASTSLSLAKKINAKREQARLFYHIAHVYALLQYHKTALTYLEKALNLYRQLNDLLRTCYVLNRISVEYGDMKNYTMALVYDQKSWALVQKLNSGRLKADILCELAWDNYCIKNYLPAYQYCQQLFKLKAADQALVRSPTIGTLGDIYRDAPVADLEKMGIKPARRQAKALACFTEQLNIARAQNSVYEMSGALDDMSGMYAAQKEYKNAYDAFKQYIVYRDSLNNRDKQKAVIQYGFREEYKQKADSIKYQQQLSAVKSRQQTNYFVGGIAVLLLITFFVLRNSLVQRKLNKIITTEKQRSDNLLVNILPADVAEELKTKGSANARLFDEVTVLFTDFVNFTTISELLSPQELVDELHQCFKAFDEIVTTHHIEKIKTIGDAYLAVSGLPNTEPEHAANAVKAALAIQQFIQQRKQARGHKTFNIRIGIHSGSVVAGIVGVKKFAYDVWGDTVNTAARMEQNSEPGKVNVSEKTYELVKDKFAFTYRGEIEAKNKGALKMYFVLGALKALQ